MSGGPVIGDLRVQAVQRKGRATAYTIVWPDGSLHRNPLGDGTLGCDDATRPFTPAPGAPIAAVVDDGGATRTITIPGDATAFIDYNGVAQGLTPTVDTRGVLLSDGSRVYVDVYPEF